MRIIRLGNINVQFCCDNCSTIWEVNTSEIKKDENNCYYIDCPLCNKRIIMNDSFELVKFLNKRAELRKERK